MIKIKKNNGIFYVDSIPKEMLALLRKKYLAAEPFSHIVLDDFFPSHFLDEIIESFPSQNQATVSHKSKTQFLKKGYRPQQLIGNPCTHYLSILNSPKILTFLEELTDISGLIPDPYYIGGGLHETKTKGYLDIHVDFSLHKQLQLARRINMIIFLNRKWKPEYGGELELWDKKMNGKVISIEPIYNRCVIFSTTQDSFHGQPNPVSCPRNMTRRSIALYYYTCPNTISDLTTDTKWSYKLKNANSFSKAINRLRTLLK